MTDNLPDYFSINAWKIDCQRNLAWLENEKVLVEPKAMMVLQYLASRPGETVSRQVLFDEFWPKQVVTEDALNRVMSSLRRLFKDSASNPEYIATIRKVGYKLVANVTVLDSLTQEPEKTTEDVKLAVTETATNDSAPATSNRPQWLAYLSAALVLIAGWFYMQQHQQQAATATVTRLTHDNSINIMPAQSHQGDSFAYIAAQPDSIDQLMLREKSATFPAQLGKESSYSYPVFSPNDQQIAAIAQQAPQQFAIELFDANNYQLQTAIEIDALSHGLSWHPTKKLLAYSQPTSLNGNHAIQLWDLSKGQALALTEAVPGANDTLPIFSPTGDSVLFQRQLAFKEHAIFVADLTGKTRKISPYFSNILGVSWLNEQQLLLSLNKGLFTLSLNGEMSPWDATNVSNAHQINYNPQQSSSLFSSRSRQHQNQIYDFTSQPNRFALTRSDADDFAANISLDTQHFAFISDRSGKKRIWLRSGDQLKPITSSEFSEIFDLSWSPDSSHFSAVVKDQGRYGLFIYAVATDEQQVHWQSTYAINGIGWKTPQTLLFSELSRHKQQIEWRLKSLDIVKQQKHQLADFDVFQGRLSANGDSLIYLDASHNNLWSWDWQSKPVKLNISAKLDRNWDVNQQQLIWIETTFGKTQLMRADLNTLKITTEPAKSLSAQHRPQALLHGITATQVNQQQADIWQINQL